MEKSEPPLFKKIFKTESPHDFQLKFNLKHTNIFFWKKFTIIVIYEIWKKLLLSGLGKVQDTFLNAGRLATKTQMRTKCQVLTPSWLEKGIKIKNKIAS